MIFTLENIINSLAGVLKAQYPDYPVYDSPNQQGKDYPCFFIFFMPSEISGQVDGRFLRDLGVDIVFVQQRNIVNGNKEIYEIADYLDEALERFAYSDENGASGLIRTFERQWQNEDQELHYKFHIRERVYIPRKEIFMERLEEDSTYVKKQ